MFGGVALCAVINMREGETLAAKKKNMREEEAFGAKKNPNCVLCVFVFRFFLLPFITIVFGNRLIRSITLSVASHHHSP